MDLSNFYVERKTYENQIWCKQNSAFTDIITTIGSLFILQAYFITYNYAYTTSNIFTLVWQYFVHILVF